MIPDLTHRSTETEAMDDFSIAGDLLQRSLDKIAWINRWLGGNRLTIVGLRKLWNSVPPEREITIVDLGCGNGDMLRVVAEVARREGRKVKLIGIDANQFTINYAREQSVDYPEISYLQELIPSAAFTELEYDILLSTLFFHHFSDQEIVSILGEVTTKAKVGLVINDLHRNLWAIFLFRLLTIFIPNPMVRRDGEISIRRGFRKPDLQAFAQQLGLKNSEIHWRWAFRYQWIIRCAP